jgi:hypothetical protein
MHETKTRTEHIEARLPGVGNQAGLPRRGWYAFG